MRACSPSGSGLSCKQILELCHPELWALSGEPEDGLDLLYL